MSETARIRRARWQGVAHSSLASRLIDIVCGLVGAILLIAVATVQLDGPGSRQSWR